VLGVAQWAEIRRLVLVEGRSQRAVALRLGVARDTVAKAIHTQTPPRYLRAPAGSKLDPFKDWICEQLQVDPAIPSLRLREMAGELGYEGGKTIFDGYVREVRPRFQIKRTFQRTVYRPGELVQCDLWEPREPVPVGHGQIRRGWVVTAEVCWSRVIAGALIFSKQAPDILWALGRCLERIGALPGKLVWDREGAIHAGGGRPTEEFAAFCGQLGVGWVILDPGDAQAKGALERSHRFLRSNFEPGRVFANPLDFQLQLDGWCDRVNRRVHARSAPSPPSGSSKSASGCGRCRPPCPTSTAGRWCGCPSSPICASIATTTRSTPRSRGAASRRGSPNRR
jgi:transposase